MFEDDSQGPLKTINFGKETLTNRNQSLNSNNQPTFNSKDKTNEDLFKNAHEILKEEDEFAVNS